MLIDAKYDEMIDYNYPSVNYYKIQWQIQLD